jgi:hypothetical protein
MYDHTFAEMPVFRDCGFEHIGTFQFESVEAHTRSVVDV